VGSKEKREEKIRSNTSNVSLEDFEALIKQYGYIKEGSKHPKAIIGSRVFPYRRTNPVRRVYVDKILEIIDGLNKETNHG
jgi:hypothetical protein